MLQDYRHIDDDQLEALEKQCLRTIVQAMQEYSSEAKSLFETTRAESETEVIVLAEDITQYALEVAECYPINKRFAGFIDYKRVRWLSTPFAILPQVLLVDAKASKENNRDTLQQSQLPMDAEYKISDRVQKMSAGVPPHMDIAASTGSMSAVTTSILVHFYYSSTGSQTPPYRNLHCIYILALPHQRLKWRYNPNSDVTFFGAGKHSPRRGEAPRIRVYFDRLRKMCPWRLQELCYMDQNDYTSPQWRDALPNEFGNLIENVEPFDFIGRTPSR